MQTEEEKPSTWRRLHGEKIIIPILEKIKNTIIEEHAKGHKLKVCIGTDSVVGVDNVRFATVIVFLRERQGGFMYIRDSTDNRLMHLKERMLMEVQKSIDIAYELCDIFNEYNVDMEVHADINTNPSFKSNVALKEAMGYILGMGFAFKGKPDALAASDCADKALFT
jgi:uncharacterized protein